MMVSGQGDGAGRRTGGGVVVERAKTRPSGSEEEARRLSQRLADDSGDYPDHLPGDEQGAWMEREAVVDMLAGMLATYADGGRVDKPLLDQVCQLARGLAARDETVDAAVAFLAGTFRGGVSR